MSGIQTIARHSVDAITKNSPAILTAFGVAGVAITAYFTAKATVRAAEIIKDYENKENGLWVKSTAKEKLSLTWKLYVPAVLSCGLTVGSIISSQAINSKRHAALFTAVALGETALSEYQDKVKAELGKNKAEKIRDAVTQDKVTELEKKGGFDHLTLIDTQDQYVFETFSGRPLISTVEKLNKAANDIARDCINHDYASLNSFFRKIGLPEIPIGEDYGWNNAHPIEIDLSSAVVHDGKGLIAINYEIKPRIGYADLWGS